MALTVRRTAETTMAIVMIRTHNLYMASSGVVGSNFHADITSTSPTDQYVSPQSPASVQVTAANMADATGGPYVTGITLINNIMGVLQLHLNDGISTNLYAAGAHKIPDLVNRALLPFLPPGSFVTSGTNSTDLTNLIANANTIKSLYNAHLTQASPSQVHFTNDGTNAVAASNASDQPSLTTLLNAIKSALNAHITSAPGSFMVNIVNA